MANWANKKGTQFESGFARYWRDATGDGRLVYRPRLHGDGGGEGGADLKGLYAHDYEGVAECKYVETYGDSLVSAWRNQAREEREAAGVDFGLLVIHLVRCDSKGRSPSFGRNRVDVTLRDLARLCGGDGSGVPDDVWATLTVDAIVGLATR